MSTVINIEPRIKNLKITEEIIIADLEDGRTISVPLAWSWRLSDATKNSVKNLKSLATALMFTGRTSMKILAPKAC